MNFQKETERSEIGSLTKHNLYRLVHEQLKAEKQFNLFTHHQN